MENARRATNPIITSLYLHVQTVNEQAIRFYTRNGFRIQAIVHDYYKLIENRDAYILSRPVFHVYEHPLQQLQLQQQQQQQNQQYQQFQ